MIVIIILKLQNTHN